jgi:sulfatase maturation enzyme AslB (radical SAM superfamily)
VANSAVFCNTPWYELHIYWDGSLGICCQESRKLYAPDSRYNIARMSIAEWFNSEPVTALRQHMLLDSRTDVCSRCYHEEHSGAVSRRQRSNQKSVIFVQAFDQSFAQSPGRQHFDAMGHTLTQPIDVHIDLGNHCNLACKMCNSQASSKIAVQEVKWGIESSKQYVGTDWTRDQVVWDNFKAQLVNIPKLKNIHLMGGETMIASRFEDLVDTLTEHQRFDVGFSFVTNGTSVNPDLINKLKKFTRVGIEVSIETTTPHNSYVRQGTDTKQVLKNIAWYQSHTNNTNISVTLRPAISMLTIGYYSSLLEYAWHNQLTIKSLLVTEPDFLNVSNLPADVKQQYSATFDSMISRSGHVTVDADYNVSDPNNYQAVIQQQARMCKQLLDTPVDRDSSHNHRLLAEHCQRWDQVYGHNAKTLYPELQNIWAQYGYTGPT